jgi:ABC-type cobalamin/Fe3+-siderophores transport system ATPase subunit
MILGIAFRKGSEKWSYIPFNPNLNCIVGKKATHKSTIVDLILYGVNRFHDDDEKEMEKKLIDKGYSVEVFFKKVEDVFCCCRSKKGSPPSWYKLGPAKKIFVKLDEEPSQLALPRKYHHEGITGRFSDKTNLMLFIDWDILRRYRGMEKCLKKCNKYLEKMKEKDYVISSSDKKQLKTDCQELFEKRKSIKKLAVKEVKSKGRVTEVEIFLPQYGKKGDESMFKVKVKKAKYTGNIRGDYIDQASLYVLDGKKYKSFDRLSTGKKNAVIMAFLMNQESFGPLIIDEPEQYLDVSAITGTLVPRMRLLKTEQQIICVTKDEHILLSGDAENVVVTQSEKGIKVINGDINDRKIQQQVLEIFEGDRKGKSLQDKNRKLAAILEQQ